jgi:AI-2E family transporter
VLTPKLVGDRVGLSPVTVIFAVMTGGSLFGFLGMLLALPVASVANVLIRHLMNQYHASHFYLDHPNDVALATEHLGSPPGPPTSDGSLSPHADAARADDNDTL